MATQQPLPEDPEEKKADLLATLAAARELGPDMDKALAESYLQRQRAEAAPKQQVVAQPPRVPQQAGEGMRPVFMVGGLILFIALLIVSHGWLWWTFFPIMAWSGWWWRGGSRDEWHYQRRMQREEWRQARREMRYGPRYNYHYDYHYGYRYGDRDDTPPAQHAEPLAPPETPPSANSPAGQQPSAHAND